jgi:hypothetical protein
MESKRSSSGKGGKGRGPVDSGKGVRIQVSQQPKTAVQQQQAATSLGTETPPATAANVAVVVWMIWCSRPRTSIPCLHSLTLLLCSLQGGKVYDSKHGVTCHW